MLFPGLRLSRVLRLLEFRPESLLKKDARRIFALNVLLGRDGSRTFALDVLLGVAFDMSFGLAGTASSVLPFVPLPLPLSTPPAHNFDSWPSLSLWFAAMHTTCCLDHGFQIESKLRVHFHLHSRISKSLTKMHSMMQIANVITTTRKLIQITYFTTDLY